MDKSEKILQALCEEDKALNEQVTKMLCERIRTLVTDKADLNERIEALQKTNMELVSEKDEINKQYYALLLKKNDLEQQIRDLSGEIFRMRLRTEMRVVQKNTVPGIQEINAGKIRPSHSVNAESICATAVDRAKINAGHISDDPITCHSAKASDILYDTKLIPGETVFVNGQAYYVKSVDIITGEYVLERADLPTTEKTTIKDRNDGSIVVFEKDHPTNRMYAIQANWWSHAKISRFLHKRCSGAFMKADERGVSLIVTPYNHRAIHANVGDWLLALVEHPTELYVCSKDTFWKIYAKE